MNDFTYVFRIDGLMIFASNSAEAIIQKLDAAGAGVTETIGTDFVPMIEDDKGIKVMLDQDSLEDIEGTAKVYRHYNIIGTLDCVELI